MFAQQRKTINRLKPLSLDPLSPEDALRGAMKVSAPDKGTAKKKRRKAKRKTAKKKN